MLDNIEDHQRDHRPDRAREQHDTRAPPGALMKHLRVAGLCLAATIAVNMASSATASASSSAWEQCATEKASTSPTKYTTNQCTTASSTGGWAWQEVTSSEKVREKGSLLLKDTKTLVGEASIECSTESVGAVGPGKLGKTTEVKVEAAKCRAVKGCENVEAVEARNLPWSTELYEESGKVYDKLVSGTGGEPGWKFKCKIIISATDECLQEAEKPESLEMANKVTGSELLVSATYAKKVKTKCSQGGEASGATTGTLAISKENGWGLRVRGGGEHKYASSEGLGRFNEASKNVTHCIVGDSINCATGNLADEQTDLSIGGRGPGLRVVRSYNSLAAAEASEAGAWGFGWSGPYSAHLVEAGGTATVFHDNGSAVVFTIEGSKYTPGPWVEATLVKEGTNYINTLPQQRKLEFNSEGRLTKETDRNGNSITLAYNAEKRLETATDGDSRKLTFKYNAGHQVESVTDPMGHIVKYTYESGNLATVTLPGETELRWKFSYESHLLTTLTDGRKNSTTNEYDGSHRVKKQVIAAHTRKLTYGATPGTETTLTEPNGSETIEHFNAAGEPTKITRASGVVGVETTTEYEYNGPYELVKLIDPNKHVTEYGYNGKGDKTSEKDPNGDEQKWTYNGTHDVETETTPEGETTTIKRDGKGNPETIERPIGSEVQKTKYIYGAKGDLEEATDPLGNTTKYKYDAAGDREIETDPEKNERKWKYNEDSQKTEETSPRGFTTKTKRDEQGRPIEVTDPLGHVTEYKYDGNGNVTGVTDGNKHTTKYVYNEENLPTKVEEPTEKNIETGYDTEGRMTSHTDGNSHKWEYKRNQLEQVTEEVNPTGKMTKKKYDKAGNLETLEDPEKHTTTYKYDESNRLTRITYSTGKPSEVTYEYNRDSRVLKMTDGTGTTKNTYDKLDRLKESENGAKKLVKYEYNLANEPAKITYPNEKAVTRGYDKDSRLEKITDWNSKVTKFTYNADSQPETTLFPSETGNEDKYAYNEADQMREVEMKGTEKLGTLVYERDGDGQVKKTATTVLPGPASNEHKYDESDRLTEDNKLLYEYDKANNPTKIEGAGGYTYNAADELEKGPAATYAFNADGQRTETKPTKGPTTTYGYDQAGNLTSVERPEATEKPKIEDSFTYDGNNLRASQTLTGAKTNLTWDTAEELPLVLEDETNSYIYGPENLPVEQISTGGTTLYFHHDQQGSTRVLSGSTGKAEAAFTYNPYGTLNASAGTATTPLRYDGEYTNTDTGLIYLRARTYDPATAQFLSVSPTLAETVEPYSYTTDNPLNASDPGGEQKPQPPPQMPLADEITPPPPPPNLGGRLPPPPGPIEEAYDEILYWLDGVVPPLRIAGVALRASDILQGGPVHPLLGRIDVVFMFINNLNVTPQTRNLLLAIHMLTKRVAWLVVGRPIATWVAVSRSMTIRMPPAAP